MSFGPSKTSTGADTRPDPLVPLAPGPVGLDTEWNGTDVHGRSLPVGASAADTAGRAFYWPWGHAEGDQHRAEHVRAHLREQLRGRDVALREAKQDLEMLRKWGLDLEALGCRPHEVQHAAALLDDRRRKFTLEDLMQDRLGRGKAECPVPKKDIWQAPPHLVAEYARADARGTLDLHLDYYADIERQGLGPVLELEDSLIWCVMHMEREGMWLDTRKLARWTREVENERVGRLLELHRRTGLRVNPDSGPDMARLWSHLNLPAVSSFDDEHLAEFLEVPEVKLAADARDLGSLLSKYLVKYAQAMTPEGLLRYRLHQLRADEGGTISGRFASSRVNIQQVMNPKKQAFNSPATKNWIIRELFIPPPGRLWFKTDAMQIEYRLFVHYSKSQRLIEAYKRDPLTNFHKYVGKEILHDAIPYEHTKNVNFAKLYGAGVAKISRMLNQDEEDTRETVRLYDSQFPEAKRLLNEATRAAEHRGFVKTFMGRRSRYQPGDRFYSALNRVLQGTAADLMKLALKVIYDERKTLDLNLRSTQHDEGNGDLSPDEKKLKMARELLNEQRLPLRVPILWDSNTGPTWKEAA